MSATKSASREMPTVNTTSSSEALTPDANHAKPTAVMSGPVRSPGRRHQATRPGTGERPADEEPEHGGRCRGRRRARWPRTSAAYANPPASAAPASAASASRSDGKRAPALHARIVAPPSAGPMAAQAIGLGRDHRRAARCVAVIRDLQETTMSTSFHGAVVVVTGGGGGIGRAAAADSSRRARPSSSAARAAGSSTRRVPSSTLPATAARLLVRGGMSGCSDARGVPHRHHRQPLRPRRRPGQQHGHLPARAVPRADRGPGRGGPGTTFSARPSTARRPPPARWRGPAAAERSSTSAPCGRSTPSRPPRPAPTPRPRPAGTR